jgi:acyl-CoA hydrolase/GNAT superfamily N-acetyltransferase
MGPTSKEAGWRERYRSKLTSPARAVGRVRRGDRVFIGAGCGEPQAMVEALTEAGSRLADTEVYHLLTLGTAPYAAPRFSEVFRHNSFFIGSDVREDVAEGRADYTPVFLSEVPRLFASGRIPIDVAVIQLSPPDAHGYCSYGVAVDITKPAAETARLRIGQINRAMPRTLGDSFIHVDLLDEIVEVDEPILSLPETEPDEVSLEIGRHVAKLVEDGACLQIGIGHVPGAFLRFLHGRRDLGVHTEMFTDALIDLVEQGVITNAQKRLHRGKMLASFCMGTPRLYEFIDDNPRCEFRPSDYVNDPFIISQNDRMIAVNGALEVDLTGQVCSDSLGYMFYSGIGGQVDFIRGAARSLGGRPVVCLPSLGPEGQSRIVDHLSEGAGVVTTRGDVHYVVTEYGIAHLHGRSIRERAMALIEIAHPEHRQALLTHAKDRRYVFLDQTVPRSPRYPSELERWVSLDDGAQVLIRPVRPMDDSGIRDLFYDASEQSVYQRFLSTKTTLPRREREGVVNIDYDTAMSLTALHSSGDVEEIVALAEWRLDPTTRLAEVAFLVRDDWQRRGLGSRMLDYLIELAMATCITGFVAEVLASNRAMLEIFHQCSQTVTTRYSDGGYSVLVEFDKGDAEHRQAGKEAAHH